MTMKRLGDLVPGNTFQLKGDDRMFRISGSLSSGLVPARALYSNETKAFDPDMVVVALDGDAPASPLVGRFAQTIAVDSLVPHQTAGLQTAQIRMTIELRSDHPLFPLVDVLRDNVGRARDQILGVILNYLTTP